MHPRSSAQTCETADSVWKRYYPQLVRIARDRLRALPRRDADEEDVASSALKSFYRGLRAGDFPDLSDPSSLWKVLLTITIRKANRRIRYQLAEKRGSGKVRGESAFDMAAPDGMQPRGIECIPNGPPMRVGAEAVVVECREMLEQLGDEQLIRVATWKLEGRTNEEIAERLTCTVRTVERKLFRIRLKWERLSNPE